MPCSLVGANSKLLVKPETVWGTPPTGNWIQVPFISSDFGSVDDMSGGDVLGYGRDAQRQSRDGVTVRGRLTVPVDLTAIGYWLTAGLGAAANTGTTDVTHVWKSGAVALPSISLQFTHPDGSPTPIFVKYRGVLVDSMSLSWGATGRAQLELNLIGIDEVEDNVDLGGTPTTPAPVWFDQSAATLLKDAVALAKVTDLQLNVTNNWDAVKTIGSAGLVSCADPGMFAPDGEITVRDNADVLAPLAKTAATFDLQAGWSKSATQALVVDVLVAELVRRPRAIRGPGAIQRVFGILGSRDATAGNSVTVTLKNQTPTY
jgi:hypothetical protein